MRKLHGTSESYSREVSRSVNYVPVVDQLNEDQYGIQK